MVLEVAAQRAYRAVDARVLVDLAIAAPAAATAVEETRVTKQTPRNKTRPLRDESLTPA